MSRNIHTGSASMISEQSSREDWWTARRDSGAFRVLACLLTGGGRDMFLSRLEDETIFRHRQAAAEAGGTFAGTIQRHPRGSVPARGVFRTSPETLKNADCLTDAEKLPLFREAEQDWQRAIEAVREVENKREQERRARAACICQRTSRNGPPKKSARAITPSARQSTAGGQYDVRDTAPICRRMYAPRCAPWRTPDVLDTTAGGPETLGQMAVR